MSEQRVTILAFDYDALVAAVETNRYRAERAEALLDEAIRLLEKTQRWRPADHQAAAFLRRVKGERT